MTEKIKFPLRMLVICEDSLKGEVGRIIASLERPDIRLDFESDIEKGMHQWQQRVYDLTLVQPELSGGRNLEGTDGERPWYFHHLDDVTETAIQSMQMMLKDKQHYAFLNGICHVGKLPTVNPSGRLEIDKTTLIDWVNPRSKNFNDTGGDPREFVARFVSLYKDCEKEEWEEMTGRFGDLLTSFDAYLIVSQQEIPWLQPVCGPKQGGPLVYVTNRKPCGAEEAGKGKHDTLLDSTDHRKLYLGPVTRDQKRPLWMLVDLLFGQLETKNEERLRNMQEEILPLPFNEQMCLSFRLDLPKPPRESLTETENTVLTSRVPFEGPERPSGQKSEWKIEAAATPLTATSTIGLAHARGVLLAKAKALLAGPFDSVVLKTVYLDDERDGQRSIRWPAIQAQSHHRTRCLRSVEHPRTLWNTGITALEAFTPEMQNGFLRACLEDQGETEPFGKNMEKLVVSLGSNFPITKTDKTRCYRQRGEQENHEQAFKRDLRRVWTQLFSTVFCGIPDDKFPKVEINVRHYLRENVAHHIGGDEYLNPDKIDGAFSRSHGNALLEFGWWLEVLHDVAVRHKKELILKLPYRSDILAFIRAIFDSYHKYGSAKGSGIRGICLINAFKSAVCDYNRGEPYTPAWYGRVRGGWCDAKEREAKYQMSGEMLQAARNQLILRVLQGAEDYSGEKKLLEGFDFRLSGGVVSQEGISYCHEPPRSREKCWSFEPTVQIGTWGLLDLNLRKRRLPRSCASKPPVEGEMRPALECKKACTECAVEAGCKNGVIRVVDGKAQVVAEDNCKGCRSCEELCRRGLLRVVPRRGAGGVPQSEDRVHRNGAGSVEGGVAESTGGACREDADRHLALNPRFAYLLHQKCVGCGDCSRSFYCDVFLDRQGLRRHPLMDPRNCTGCGLCAQVCHKGAIQLFEPQHFVALISSMGERSDILRTLMVPHMTYEPTHDLELLVEGEDDKMGRGVVDSARELIKGENAGKDELTSWAAKLWRFRWDGDRFALNGTEEERRARFGVKEGSSSSDVEKVARDRARELWEALAENVRGDPIARSVAARAFVWSQIIWSDPGRVLWESPIVVVRTSIQGVDRRLPPTTPDGVREQLIGLMDGGEFGVVSYFAVLCRGAWQQSGSQLTDGLRLSLDRKGIEAYSKAGMGIGRLSGLDVRGCPNMLERNGGKLKRREILNIAGIPWQELRKVAPIGVVRTAALNRVAALSG